jgi:hypothetical protein
MFKTKNKNHTNELNMTNLNCTAQSKSYGTVQRTQGIAGDLGKWCGLPGQQNNYFKWGKK